MRKLGIFILGTALSVSFLFCNTHAVIGVAEEKNVYVGGMSAGFTLKTGGNANYRNV